ncbi:MAG TPA: hypothetical protein VMJ65_07415 [Solirubrobacteraceae bacterium]|nr:hypothetical protein [Solirubrobacteraceae bacterium]
MLTRETVTFRDASGWSWEFDLTFMLSNYQCLWGHGCPDTTGQHTARGCCVEGVEIYQGDGDTPGSADLKKIRGHVKHLTDEDWQNRGVALARGGRDPWGKARFKRDSVHTRLYRGACIFHNRENHPAGAGCALHVAALRRGEDPIEWKPRICWQVPLFFDVDEKTKTTAVRASRTVDWGGDEVLEWWCTEQQDAFSGDQPVYVSMAAELQRVCGAAVYDELARYCQARRRGEPSKLTLLPMWGQVS